MDLVRRQARVWTYPSVPGSVSRAQRPVRLARFNQAPFASRLVRKFDLPVEGWRASASADESSSGGTA